MKSLRFFLIAGMLFSWIAAGVANAATSGVIHFYGAIVEGPCTVKVVDSTAQTQCYRDGQNYTSKHRLASLQSGSKALPMNLGKSEIKWLDQQKKLGIMTLEYH
ncbi:type 1 fimbrial protein [Serratia fonticola]|uniref:type 1 fimbrial protein n=1 Tax=Serratia fonticola TaxID=47917 RepID=UPI0015C694D0|nr:type 1 fimbrial protein [Serratia fonticola]MBC3379675.1 type 1 fimbrial protein [Serratia fonticola]NYA38875.1 type 1 fimbrial protein [Serratia fonticola]